MSEMRFNGGSHEGKGVAALLTAGFDYRQHRLDKATAGDALRSKRQLPPNHRVTQRTLTRVVRRFDPFIMQERPQPAAMLVQLPARALHVSIAALKSAQQQTLQLPADRTHATNQCGARDRARAIVSPMLEQLTCGMSQPLD